MFAWELRLLIVAAHWFELPLWNAQFDRLVLSQFLINLEVLGLVWLRLERNVSEKIFGNRCAVIPH